MTSMTKFFLGMLAGILLFTGFLLVKRQNLGASASSGDMIGIYNATTTDLVLRDGFGSALAVDQNGRLITTSTSP